MGSENQNPDFIILTLFLLLPPLPLFCGRVVGIPIRPNHFTIKVKYCGCWNLNKNRKCWKISAGPTASVERE